MNDSRLPQKLETDSRRRKKILPVTRTVDKWSLTNTVFLLGRIATNDTLHRMYCSKEVRGGAVRGLEEGARGLHKLSTCLMFYCIESIQFSVEEKDLASFSLNS